MIGVSLRFPGGRFHATPWSQHANEGAVEWPPSPWRLLRALVAVWRRLGSGSSADLERLLRTLAGDLPEFVLPPAATGHRRHYMPIRGHRPPDDPKTKLVVDAFVTVPPTEPVVIRWPSIDLDDADRELFAHLVGAMPYFGRAESCVEGTLIGANDAAPTCVPVGRATDLNVMNLREVRVLVGGSGVTIAHVEEPSEEIRRRSRPLPRSSRYETYVLRADALECAPPVTLADLPVEVTQPAVSRLKLTGPVLPSVRETLPVAEAVRKASMFWFSRLYGHGAPGVLSGKDEVGQPLTGHRHAYFLPIDSDGDGRIDTVLVVAAEGLDRRVRRTLQSIREIWSYGDVFPRVRIGVSGFGGAVGKSGLLDAFRETLPARFIGPARTWHFATPWLPGRYPKYRQRRDPVASLAAYEKMLVSDLAKAGMTAERVDFFPACRCGDRWLQVGEFRTQRKGKQRRPAMAGAVSFEVPVAGPLVVGAGAHFGLGIMVTDGEACPNGG